MNTVKKINRLNFEIVSLLQRLKVLGYSSQDSREHRKINRLIYRKRAKILWVKERARIES